MVAVPAVAVGPAVPAVPAVLAGLAAPLLELPLARFYLFSLPVSCALPTILSCLPLCHSF